ncbi:MAG: SDR family NAD(P)-dependent oxidoreductase [Marivibrio sp.]|uniref:SDR family NAD(P)-dependent oxidoreductase n=1 Tax=Marivibrio sp. TaxID=2039719 RepID=UPI0032ED0973
MTVYDGKRVFVTGAEGFIGSHLADALVRKGASVTALALYNSFGTSGWLDRLDSEVRKAMHIVHGDVRDPHMMRRLIHNQDIVFHLAALIAIPYSYAAPQSYVDTNVSGTLNILEAVKGGGAGRLVHTSTSEVYGTAQFTPISESHPLQGQSPYSASKIAADHLVESYVRSFETPAVILRPFNTFGPRQSERAVIPTVVRQALDPACAEIRLGDPSPVRDFNYVEDIAAAFLAAGSAPDLPLGRPFNAGSGRAVTIGEMTERVREITGCNKPIVEESARRRPARSEVFELLADPNAFGSATGWRSEIGFEVGLERTVEWWRNEIAAGRLRLDSGYQV